jgi:hypothetical protein
MCHPLTLPKTLSATNLSDIPQTNSETAWDGSSQGNFREAITQGRTTSEFGPSRDFAATQHFAAFGAKRTLASCTQLIGFMSTRLNIPPGPLSGVPSAGLRRFCRDFRPAIARSPVAVGGAKVKRRNRRITRQGNPPCAPRTPAPIANAEIISATA